MELPTNMDNLLRIATSVDNRKHVVANLDLFLKIAFQFGRGEGMKDLAKAIEIKTLQELRKQL